MNRAYAVGVMNHTFDSAIGVVGEGKDLEALVDSINGLKSQVLRIFETSPETTGKMIRIDAKDSEGNDVIVAHSPFMAEDSLIHPIIDASVHSLAGVVRHMPEIVSGKYKGFDAEIYRLETADEVHFTAENYDGMANNAVGVRIAAKLPLKDAHRAVSKNYFFSSSGKRPIASDVAYAALDEHIRHANHDMLVKAMASGIGYDREKIEDIEKAIAMVQGSNKENLWKSLSDSWQDNARTGYNFDIGLASGPEILTSRYILVENGFKIQGDRIGVVTQPYSVRTAEPRHVAFVFNGGSKPAQYDVSMRPIIAKPMNL